MVSVDVIFVLAKSLAVVPGRAKREPGTSRFRVRCCASPRNDGCWSLQIGLLEPPNNAVLSANQRLQSCATLSRAWASPFSEKVSVVSVPLADMPLTVTSADLRIASTMRSSSAAFLIQSPSPWVYIAYDEPPTSS